MTALPERRWSWRLFAYALAGLCVAVFVAANGHLIYVAVTSQPECVPHQKSDGSLYQAAKPAC